MISRSSESGPESRRARQRRELVAEITAEARRLLESGGRAAVGWRDIAGSVGLSPASMYTYFASLDDLFTELILQTYSHLHASIERTMAAFAAAPVEDRVLAGPLAYRRWALANRGQFNLIFTDQISGYSATANGPTVEAEVSVFRPMATALTEALGADQTDLESGGPGLDRFIGLWGLLHGLTSLEVNHHLDWIDAGRTYEQQVRSYIDALGVAPASDIAKRLNRLHPLRRGV